VIRSRLSTRLRLRKNVIARGHRYARVRLFTLSGSILILLAVPASRLIRFDAFGGEHYVLFERASALHAVAGVFVGFCSLVALTFAFNLVGSRLFCGWGCPAAQISRFGEAVESAKTTGKSRGRSVVQGAAFSAVFAVALMSWWTDLSVFVQGSAAQILTAGGVLSALVALSFVHGHYWRWGFCKTACPIGLYYSVVSPSVSYGVVFEEKLSTCIDCNACTSICPVELEPRRLSLALEDARGLAMGGLPADNHCLRCGDCITACEMVLRDQDPVDIPLHLGMGRKGTPLRPRGARHDCDELASSPQKERA